MIDVLIVGAGAAGLTAARELASHGLKVEILEARNRIGGRMHTVHSPHCAVPIELGAEFVHGRPPEILDTGLPLYELNGENYTEHGRQENHFWPDVDRILSGMEQVKDDLSFASYIAPLPEAEEAKHHAIRYVEGFNAADAERISVRSLVQESEAEESIQGDSIYRLNDGYAALLEHLRPSEVPIRLATVVRRIEWSPGSVLIQTATTEYRARTCVVTVPLGVLQAGSIEFAPAVPAPKGLVMGEVIRVALVFDESFWEKQLEKAFFLFTDKGLFPTWWTTHPKSAPLIVGWAAGKKARPLSGLPADKLEEEALHSLASLVNLTSEELRSHLRGFYVHDWQSDPYSLGAYSYVEVGGMDAARDLARPLENTLFFAGEATESTGYSATVHGAIKSGVRVSREVIEALQSIL